MRKIEKLVVHCSATKPEQNIDAQEINRWHMAKGWSEIGYHFVICRNGDIQIGRNLDRAGAHVKGHNDDSIGICLVGGVDEKDMPDFNFTFNQMAALARLLADLSNQFEVPTKNIVGHRDFDGVNKACPCFDVPAFLGLKT